MPGTETGVQDGRPGPQESGTEEKPPPTPAPPLDTITPEELISLPGDESSALMIKGEHSYEPGNFLAGKPGGPDPEGFLLKVVSSKIVGGDTLIETEPGSLYEAVPNGEIDLDLSSMSAARPLNKDARSINGAITRSTPNEPIKLPFNQELICKGSEKFKFKGHLDTKVGPHLKIKWHKFLGVPTGVDTAKATLNADLDAEAEAELAAKASCDLNPITLLEPEWTVMVEVGPVPVPVTIRLPIDIRLHGVVEGKARVKGTAEAHGSLGVSYEHGELVGIHEFSSDGSLEKEVKAEASLEATVGPTARLTAGWKIPHLGEIAAELGIGARSGVRLDYEPFEPEPWSLCVPFRVEGSIKLDIPFGNVEKGPTTLYHADLKCIHWGAEIQRLHWTGTVTYTGSSIWEDQSEVSETSGSATWLVDGYSPEGTNGENGQRTSLGFTGSWTGTLLATGHCNEAPNWQATVEGSGTGTDSGGATGPDDPYPHYLFGVFITPHDYAWDLGTVPGEWHEQGTIDCNGYTVDRTFENRLNEAEGGLHCMSYEGGDMVHEPLPREGADSHGEMTAIAPDCENPGESFTDHLSWDLTIECPDGQPPDEEWYCPGVPH